MPSQDTPGQPETTDVDIEIPQPDAISVAEAMTLAEHNTYRIGKSTLQRWAKHWASLGAASPVKCILVTNRLGVAYKLSRADFEAWVIEQADNGRSPEVPLDLAGPHETQQDPMRPHKTRQDPARHREASQDDERIAALEQENADLKTENMNLKIDIGVRKGLLERAVTQFNELSTQASNLLRENGALQYQIRQLAAPASAETPAAQNDAQEPPHFATFVEMPPVDNAPGPDRPAV